ncbi:MAG: 2-octaprenyl-6-methoxyphenol 4-monooxygenase [Cyanobacteria bacterium M_surface_9_m1_291]|nr:2-octaprenyl-6-methoxyphenol 4-monooxygenase [Cyanobacteria bacterium M_surface_9_m1_291]
MTPALLPTALVRGCGPTGAVAALALADAGWNVHLHDPSGRERLLARERAYALTQSSRVLLARLQLWEALEPGLVPFQQLQLADLGSGATGVCFAAAELGLGAVGWIAQHHALMGPLLQALEQHPAIELDLGAAQPNPAALATTPDLIVAADGPHSPSREALGIGSWRWSYGQHCLTAQVDLRGSAPDQAWELFRPEGPLALLPLGGRRVQLVWSAAPERCRQLQELGADAFLDHLAGALPDRFQPDQLAVRAQSFEVGLALARRLQRGRTLLVGESAHCSHPVGGQGLNLCWRDVAVLHRLAGRVSQRRLRAERLPRHYALRRWPDLLLTLAATDLLVRIFSNRAPLLVPLRRLALNGLAHSRALRHLSLAVMTHGPCRLWRR